MSRGNLYEFLSFPQFSLGADSPSTEGDFSAFGVGYCSNPVSDSLKSGVSGGYFTRLGGGA